MYLHRENERGTGTSQVLRVSSNLAACSASSRAMRAALSAANAAPRTSVSSACGCNKYM